MKKINILLFAGLLLLMIYCSSNEIYPVEEGVFIRIENSSSSDFADVRAVFPQDTIAYGEVPENSYSDYHKVKKAYRYAYIELNADSQIYVLQPVDYFGESLLESGYYTYQLNLTGSDMYDLTLSLEND